MKLPGSRPVTDSLAAPPNGDGRKDELFTNAVDKRVIDSSRMFEGQREVRIQHGSQMHRLRLAASDKLYLSEEACQCRPTPSPDRRQSFHVWQMFTQSGS